MTRIFRVAVLLFALSAYTAHADSAEIYTAQDGSLYISQGDGLMVNLSVLESIDLLSQVQQYRSDLMQHKNQYAEAVENTRFGTGDILITVLIPGGLIYAARRKQQHIEAQQNLVTAKEKFKDLTGDLAFLKITYGKTLLASR
ncbi:MAG: hypothetical protein QNJ78_04005 [Gammaproteobacteria bacterium]|nr:hypothetical protein [Gammaproteobacteria bacterium]